MGPRTWIDIAASHHVQVHFFKTHILVSFGKRSCFLDSGLENQIRIVVTALAGEIYVACQA
jgi:hypothetical protein